MQRHKIRLLALIGFALSAGLAQASSDDAWAEFRTDVEAKCKKAASGFVESANAVVDPFGSEHYGLALVTGKPKGAKGVVTHICVYDKQKKTAEIGSELETKKLKLLPGGKQ